MRTIRDDIDTARICTERALEQLDKQPSLTAISDLIQACSMIEDYYREEFCPALDREYGDPEGTTYKVGANLEFYIEADWWHEVSLALRRLQEQNYQPNGSSP